MRLHILLVSLAVTASLLGFAAAAADASCLCDDSFERLCTTFNPPCDDGGVVEDGCGDRCCEVCAGEDASLCEACGTAATPPEDGGCNAGGLSGGLGGALLLGLIIAGRRRRAAR